MNNINSLSENDLATLLLCSDMACDSKIKPYSDSTYSKFAQALFKSGYQPSDLFSMEPSKILEITQEHKTLFTRVKNLDFSERIPLLIKRHTQLTIELSEVEKRGIRVVTRADKMNYPQKLRLKFKDTGIAIPSVIYYVGDLSLVKSIRAVAIVGSRELTSDTGAQKFTEIFTQKVSQSGFAISSGGAKGIDHIAEVTSRDCGSLSFITVPDNLAKRILEPEVRKSLLDECSVYLSLTHPNSRFSGYNAMARNKIIYALSDYAMVVTCSFVSDAKGKPYPNKGGTWVGAHECAKFNLSKLLVRYAGENTPTGNPYFANELHCSVISEDDVYSLLNFNEILNKDLKTDDSSKKSVSEGIQTDLFSACSA